MQQNGYRAAGLCAFLPAFAVLDPVVGSALGLTLYHERLDGGPARMAIEAVAVIAATWGIVRLAKSNAASSPLPDEVVVTPPLESIEPEPIELEPVPSRVASLPVVLD